MHYVYGISFLIQGSTVRPPPKKTTTNFTPIKICAIVAFYLPLFLISVQGGQYRNNSKAILYPVPIYMMYGISFLC